MTLASYLQTLGRGVWKGLDWAGEALCHPLVLTIQIAGCILLLALGVGWFWGFFRRRRIHHKVFATEEHLPLDSENTVSAMPCVSVILPVKGIRQHSISNWLAQLTSKYNGDLEYVFVVESSEDQAIPGLRSVIKQVPQVVAKIEVAGCATSCSQKIHKWVIDASMLHGLNSTSQFSKYVLFLDDDVALHEKSISDMVNKIEKNPSIFLVTGYPFDIPPEGASLKSFCVMAFHLPLMIPFCIGSTCFVWGGCMLLRRNSLLKGDPYGILGAWKDGGYSDDMLVGAKCVEHKLLVAAAPGAVFPQRLDSEYSWVQLWNYIKRQLFVLDTYATEKNRQVNHALLGVHVLGSFSLLITFIAGCLRVVLWQVDLLLILTRRIFSSEDASVDWVKLFSFSGCSMGTIVTILCFLLFIFAHSGLLSAIGELMQQFHSVFPGYVALQTDAPFYFRVWTGIFITNAIIPFCAFFTLLSPSVVWSGVQYTRKCGQIIDIKRIYK